MESESNGSKGGSVFALLLLLVLVFFGCGMSGSDGPSQTGNKTKTGNFSIPFIIDHRKCTGRDETCRFSDWWIISDHKGNRKPIIARWDMFEGKKLGAAWCSFQYHRR
jgi:hypothetical protein